MAIKTDEVINDIYILQSRNVRKLLKVKKSLLRDINRNSKLNNNSDVEIKTKMYSLLYSAWSEAQFVQILHTPKALFPRDIQDIEAEKKQNGIINGWKLLIELAINKVGNINKSSDLQTRKETIISDLAKSASAMDPATSGSKLVAESVAAGYDVEDKKL